MTVNLNPQTLETVLTDLNKIECKEYAWNKRIYDKFLFKLFLLWTLLLDAKEVKHNIKHTFRIFLRGCRYLHIHILLLCYF